MQREIIFRRAHFDLSGKFICFTYWGKIDHKNNPDDRCFKSPSNISGCHTSIDNQYTGLTDKNGKNIFEGDSIRWGMNGQEVWNRYATVCIDPDIQFKITHYINEKTGEFQESDGHVFKFGKFIYTDTHNHLEVIGNIHDNNSDYERKA